MGPVLAQIATLTEIREHWSILDLAHAHEALDVQGDFQAYASEQAQKNAKSRSN